MVQAGSCWPVITKASVHSQTSLYGIFGVKNGIATGSFASTAPVPCQYHSTNAALALIALSSTLCNVST
jgi:hypothetical protein